MGIRELRTFLAIAEGGSFASAATSVGRTHSAISVQMRALEEEFRIELFDRSHRPPILTAAGLSFLPSAVEAVAAYDRLFSSNTHGDVEGNLRIGVVPSVMTGTMARTLAALRELYPRLHVALSMGLSKELVPRVRKASLDAALVSDFKNSGSDVRWSPIAREPLVLIAPITAVARKAEDIIERYPFIRYSRHAWVGELIADFLKRRRIRVNEAMSLDTLEAIRTMVHHGLGVSVVPRRASDENHEEPVRILKFSNPACYRTLGLVQRSRHSKQPLVDLLEEVLRAEFETSSRSLLGKPHRT